VKISFLSDLLLLLAYQEVQAQGSPAYVGIFRRIRNRLSLKPPIRAVSCEIANHLSPHHPAPQLAGPNTMARVLIWMIGTIRMAEIIAAVVILGTMSRTFTEMRSTYGEIPAPASLAMWSISMLSILLTLILSVLWLLARLNFVASIVLDIFLCLCWAAAAIYFGMSLNIDSCKIYLNSSAVAEYSKELPGVSYAQLAEEFSTGQFLCKIYIVTLAFACTAAVLFFVSILLACFGRPNHGRSPGATFYIQRRNFGSLEKEHSILTVSTPQSEDVRHLMLEDRVPSYSEGLAYAK